MSTPDLSGLEVLLVDDHREAATALARILEGYGCRMHTCFDAASALESVAGFVPAVIVLDIRLPDLPGTELCRSMKALERLRDTTFVAITGISDPAGRAAVEAAGFDHVLGKPLALPMLLAVLKSAQVDS